MGLMVDVFRSSDHIDCTNKGISSKAHYLCLVNVEGPFNPDQTKPAAMLVKGNGPGLVKIVPAMPDGNRIGHQRLPLPQCRGADHRASFLRCRPHPRQDRMKQFTYWKLQLGPSPAETGSWWPGGAFPNKPRFTYEYPFHCPCFIAYAESITEADKKFKEATGQDPVKCKAIVVRIQDASHVNLKG